MHMRCAPEYRHEQNYHYYSKRYGPRGASCDGSKKQTFDLHALRLRRPVELLSCVTDTLETTNTKASPNVQPTTEHTTTPHRVHLTYFHTASAE
jgi:hypothetical protein